MHNSIDLVGDVISKPNEGNDDEVYEPESDL